MLYVAAQQLDWLVTTTPPLGDPVYSKTWLAYFKQYIVIDGVLAIILAYCFLATQKLSHP
jgi:hypothetical protein